MTVSSRQGERAGVGDEIYRQVVELYPICRSITGGGMRETLSLIQEQVPLEIHEVPTGTPVLDWRVPKEWNIRDAYVKDPTGRKVIDFKDSNLHIVSYSVPIKAQMPLSQLREHLHSLPEFPDWIPYRTTYYTASWGFCLRQTTLDGLEEGDYEVVIDTTLEDGSLTYGEYYLQGESSDEFLISCHCCHPSLCNDNLSGISLAAALARELSGWKRRYSYRFLFIPGTIGSITWLARNENILNSIKHGLVVACVGDPGISTYKKSRRGDAEIDRAVIHVLGYSDEDYRIADFSPYGYDERQYCSPGFNLPVGSLTRTPHGQYPEYHTSADNLDLVEPESLENSYKKYLDVIELIEHNRTYKNTSPKGEPQLGRRGLYSEFGGRKDATEVEHALLWTLNLSDGSNSLLDIAERSGFNFWSIERAADALLRHGLLAEIEC
jgi:aminopeptidase-like protein